MRFICASIQSPQQTVSFLIPLLKPLIDCMENVPRKLPEIHKR